MQYIARYTDSPISSFQMVSVIQASCDLGATTPLSMEDSKNGRLNMRRKETRKLIHWKERRQRQTRHVYHPDLAETIGPADRPNPPLVNRVTPQTRHTHTSALLQAEEVGFILNCLTIVFRDSEACHWPWQIRDVCRGVFEYTDCAVEWNKEHKER